MLNRTAAQRNSRLRFCVCFLAALLAGASNLAGAQNEHVRLTTPGDSLATPGPLATDLSAKISRAELAKAMKRVADWQLERLPAEAQYDWTFAALYAGYMSVPDAVAGDKYTSSMASIADKLHWAPGPRLLHADDQAVGQMYLEQYDRKHDKKMIELMRARLDAEMAVPDDAQKPLWWWCDALFMAPPVFAGVARVTGDEKYLAYMDHEWTISSDLLYDRKKYLYSRDAGYLNKHEKNGEKIFWSRGNGWVMGGIVRVLEQLPKNAPLRPKYEALLREMAAETLTIQRSDGLWSPGLLGDDYTLPEVSGSAFITYALAYGVNEKILDRKAYSPAIKKAWAGLVSHVYADGRLGCIQPVGAAPDKFSETSSYVYGVGAYLLAGSELYRTAR